MGQWVLQRGRESADTLVLGEDIITAVTRLIKLTVSEHELPSGRFSIHSLRDGGANFLFRVGVDLSYIRRFGRWKSSTFAIYLHFGDKILRNLSTCLMRIEGLTPQLKV